MKTTFALSVLALTTISSAQSTYTLSEIGGRPQSLNNAGVMTIPGAQSDHVYTQQGATVTDLGSPYAGRYNGGMAVNASGNLVGISSSVTSSSDTLAFRYTDGVFTTLGSVNGGTASRAYDVNSSGVTAGYVRNPYASNAYYAVTWTGTVGTALAPIAGGTTSSALRINDSGMVLGSSGTASDSSAVVWTNGVPQTVTPLPGDTYARPVDLNNAGQVLAQGNGGAFLWQNGVSTNLGHLGSTNNVNAFDLNGLGQAVGTSSIDASNFGDPTTAAFLYRNGQMIDMNSLLTSTQQAAYHLGTGLLINDMGQIVVLATQRSSGASVYLFLNPSPVPEPGMLAILGLSVAAPLCRRRRQGR